MSDSSRSNTTGVISSKVQNAITTVRDVQSTEEGSLLAKVLRSPHFSQDERMQVIQALARGDEDSRWTFYAHDQIRGVYPSDDYASLRKDQRTIGQALQEAFKGGFIDASDLLRIADTSQDNWRNPIGRNGAQRFMSILSEGDGGPGGAVRTGGTVEALANQLWSRGTERSKDRAIAAIEYLKDPALSARYLITPEQRREAFEALVSFNDANPNRGLNGDRGKMWRNEALVAAGQLYTTHAKEFVDHYTGAGGHAGRTEVLAKFFSHSTIDPTSRRLAIAGGKTLGEAVARSTDVAHEALFAEAHAAKPGSTEQHDCFRQIGRLNAATSAATALSLDRYSKELNAGDAERKEFAAIVSKFVGLTPLGKVPGASIVTGKATEELASRIFDTLRTYPERPNGAIAGLMFDHFDERAGKEAKQLGQPGLRNSFEGGYSTELLQLQQNLNINLGGHRTDPKHAAVSPTYRNDASRVASLAGPLLTDAAHPDHGRFKDCLAACDRAGFDAEPAMLANTAGALAAQSKVDGLGKIDHVVASNEGMYLFAISGRLDDPGHLRSMMVREAAQNQSIEQSTRQLDDLNSRQKGSVYGAQAEHVERDALPPRHVA